jgi:hypothetical protein
MLDRLGGIVADASRIQENARPITVEILAAELSYWGLGTTSESSRSSAALPFAPTIRLTG